jgi:predicted AlkP superfamily pyrophosphatase or phosphodiesterase
MSIFKRHALLASFLFVCSLAGAGLLAEGAAPTRAKAAAVMPPAPPSAYNGHPHLVVILVIDQFRGDYLDRYRADFKGHGFRLFLDKGANFPDCYYAYANTKTAPGHATIGTGAYTDGHGIGSNEWWDLDRNKDRPISSVEDDRYHLVGLADPALPAGTTKLPVGASPRNLLASTVGDELRLATQGESKVFGVSLKDRASILPAGAAANGAFWIDPATGRFVTSTFYMPKLPEWASTFNTSGRIQQAEDEANASGTTKFYEQVGSTPAANDYELDFAEALIQGEQLGQHDTTDLISVSLSANDILGHKMGPDSADEQKMVDGIDTSLDSFFTWLDKNIDGGLASVVVALSADHGVAPIPAEAAKLGLNAASIDLEKLTANLNEAINQKFSPGEKIDYLLSHEELPYLALNRPNFERAGINEQEAEQAVQNALAPAFRALSQAHSDEDSAPGKKQPSDTRLPPQPVLYRSYTRQQFESNQLPATEFGKILAHSYTPNGGWYVMVIPPAFQMEVLNGSQTTHFSPWSYDRHVPLAFFGAPFAPGVYHGRVAPVDLAATLASVLGVNQPSASVGDILTQALKPAGTVVYPKPTPVPAPPTARHRSTAAHSPESKKPQ